jgi:hypothetical protein
VSLAGTDIRFALTPAHPFGLGAPNVQRYMDLKRECLLLSLTRDGFTRSVESENLYPFNTLSPWAGQARPWRESIQAASAALLARMNWARRNSDTFASLRPASIWKRWPMPS